ncbi:protein kinase [Streptomyces sp.]|uniref:serine/threonine-protein kinase n=1 Tax=Streptomyces sp. TaxID=1931 RepID=UPI0028124024|nr:protein kinase [Streptomyces sp.]
MSSASGEYERLAGRYRIVAQLGRGGMGVVWRAVDEVLGREVAVKELRAYNDSSGPELADLRLRMQREARAAARVRHPGVVAVHDVTEHEGRPVIVMELVDGPSLDGVLGERGALDPREAAGIGAAVLEALAAAHDAGVLHRDVKPGNVLLDRGGRVVLTDFGIATMEDPGDGSATHLTRSGEIVGSLDYLAPERAQGRQPGPASDVWAVGATLYAAVEGASPFRRTSTWSTLNAIVVEPLPASHRAGPLAPVLRLLMEKDPDRRPDARTAARLLTAVAEGRETAGADPHGQDAPTAPNTPHGQGAEASPAPPYGAGTPLGGPAGFGPAPLGGPDGGGFGPAPVPSPGTGGFGPAPVAGPGGGGFGPAGPVVPPVTGPGPAGPETAPARPAPRAAGKRSTPLIAAAVAAVLLAGGGVTYALVERETAAPAGHVAGGQVPAAPGEDPGRALDAGSLTPGASATAPTATPSTTGTGSPGASAPTPSPSTSAPSRPPVPGKGATAGAGTDGGTDSGGSGGTDGATGGAGTSGDGTGGASGGTTGGATGGSTGGASGGTSTTGGGSPTPQAPACHPRADGRYDCTVWRTEKTYSQDGTPRGILNAGVNYFSCQADLGRRETSGQWTNVWWAKTDDDSGNTDVYFSVVYIQGGDNDAPVPGLPVC